MYNTRAMVQMFTEKMLVKVPCMTGFLTDGKVSRNRSLTRIPAMMP